MSTIEFYETTDGKSPIKDFFESLSDKDFAIVSRDLSLLSMITLLFLTGCSGLKPGLDTYTMPDKKETAKVNGEAKSAIERMAAKKHVKAELSDDFVSQYMDMASFDELKTRTIAGIKATQDTASMTEEEFQLWQDIINTKRLNQYTVNDLETKKSELYEILNGMAQEKNMELSGLAEKYGMTEEDLDRFINDQSEKYVDQNPDTEEDDPRMSQN